MSRYLFLILLSLVLVSCGDSASDGIKEKTHPGYEYMPDMYRSHAYETYSMNPIFSDSMSARKPVKGTIPRGFLPFEYENNLEDFKRASIELKNPFEKTVIILKKESNCMVCFVLTVMEKKEMVKVLLPTLFTVQYLHIMTM